MPKENGNKFKRKKGNRRKRTAEYNEDLDKYAKVTDRAGTKKITVLPLGNSKGDTIDVRIPGKFVKRCWFNSEDYVVIRQVADNIIEIQGKVEEKELAYVKSQFEKMDGNDMGGFTMGDIDDVDDDMFGNDDDNPNDNGDIDFDAI